MGIPIFMANLKIFTKIYTVLAFTSYIQPRPLILRYLNHKLFHMLWLKTETRKDVVKEWGKYWYLLYNMVNTKKYHGYHPYGTIVFS